MQRPCVDWRRKTVGQLLEDEFYGRPEYEGFIYILSNSTMPGILKIGCTGGTVEKRAAELSNVSGVPQQYKIEKKFPVYVNVKAMEKKVHLALFGCRINDSREFFRISLEDAVPRIQAALAGNYDFLGD